MFERLRKRCRRGFTYAELAIVTSLVAAAPAATYLQAKKRANQTKCIQQLRQIGQGLQMHLMSEGSYPDAAFYPKDPVNGKDSIRNILADQGLKDARMWCCPGLPPALTKKGLTFLYNDKIAGKNRVESVMLAYEGCARAMYQSWAVLGLGLAVFALSTFVPTQRFGAMMFLLLTCALVANMVLLPAVLASPLSYWFGRRVMREAAEKQAAAESESTPSKSTPAGPTRPGVRQDGPHRVRT